MNKNGKIIFCLICKKEFYIPKCFLKIRKYCSYKCKHIGQRSIIVWNKGKKLDKEHAMKCGSAMRGKKHTKATKLKMRLAHLGKKNSLTHSKNISEAKKKLVKNGLHNWGDGTKTPQRLAIYNSREYINWRTAVFIRDNFSCRECSQKGGKLQADHIKPFAYFPELRFVVDNGRTLCEPCHYKTDTYGSKAYKYKRNMDKISALTQIQIPDTESFKDWRDEAPLKV
jgi:hypothetical protein